MENIKKSEMLIVGGGTELTPDNWNLIVMQWL